MRASVAVGMIAAAMTIEACGGGEPEQEEPPMKVEDTAFGPLIGTQDKARDRTNAAIDAHREAMEAQIEADEAPPPSEE